MKDLSYKNRWVLVPSLLTLLLFRPSGSSAQQSAPSPPNCTSSSQTDVPQSDSQEKNDNKANGPAAVAEDANPELPHPPVTPSSPLFRLTGGGLLEGTQSPLRVGPVYLGS